VKGIEAMEAQQKVSQEQLDYWLSELNKNWKLYDDLVRGNTNLMLGAWREAKNKAEVNYSYYELK
jgi:hypothetical protein